MPNPLSAEATCTVKYQGRTLTVPAGSARDVKVGLSAWTAVAPNAIKLIRAGKVLGDDDEVAPKAKLMMMRCTPPNPTLHLCVREIVTGRLAPRLDVSASTPHDELIATIHKSLRLPPCDETTELRLFLPHLGVLMRPDLSLGDYSRPAGECLDVYAVPCPRAPEKDTATQIAHELRAAATAHVESGLTREEAALSLHELAAHAAASLPVQDALAMKAALDQLAPLPPFEDLARSLDSLSEHEHEHPSSPNSPQHASPYEYASHASAENASSSPAELPMVPETPMVLPPSIVERAASEAERAEPRPPASPRTSGGRRAPVHPASLVPTRLRTGLMAAHDEAPPLTVERPLAALLAAELENYERACEPPSEEEWNNFIAHEEARLEGRCAELIRSLMPPTPSPLPLKRRGGRNGDALRGGICRPRVRRSRSAPTIHPRSPNARAPMLAGAPADAEVLAMSRSLSSPNLEAASGSAGVRRWEEEGCLLAEECDEQHPPASVLSGPAATSCLSGEVDGASELPKGGKGGKVKGFACQTCGCRLPLTACATACKCGGCFCPAHAHDHACRFDYKRGHEAKLREENPKMEGTQLERL